MDGGKQTPEGAFQRIQKNLKLYNAVDFDDLITLPVQLLTEKEEVRAGYAARFRYVLVDEFQDTWGTSTR